jgi:lipid-A-disaccharide synthase-like uncharacterized protein
MNELALIGWAGGALLLLSWLVQDIESHRSKNIVFTAKFFWMRIIGTVCIIIEAVRVGSISLIFVNIAAMLLQGYNLKFVRKPRK